MQKRRNVIRGLRWVKALDDRPRFISSPRIKGIQRAGLIYENRIANYMKALYGDKVLHGQWYEFEDRRGLGWCQPDIIVLPDKDRKFILVLECKLKATKKAWVQLNYMYRPVLERIYPQTEIRLVQVVKNLNKELKLDLIDTVDDLFCQEKKFEYSTLFLRNLG
jgi:hypothetical protein